MQYIFRNQENIFDPFYQLNTKADPWEYELLQSRALKRLKFLSHYGTASFITAAKHSRYEHTVGVWTIIARFFPSDKNLRMAALLHDIGHLPFSHAVERTLGFNHHTITEDYIKGQEVSAILTKYGFCPQAIINLLNEDSPLTHKTPYLSADHLDSFLRDSYMLGKLDKHPSTIIENISFSGHFVDADLSTSESIMNAIFQDHKSFLEPTCLALDALLAKAISIYVRQKELPIGTIPILTNHELLQLLLHSNIQEVEEILDIIMWYPEKIIIHDEEVNNAEKIEVKKVYDKTPLVKGKPLSEISSEAKYKLNQIRSFKKIYYYSFLDKSQG
ncbi:HD superfamily phosphohydrolase [Bacillus mesophilus]|uniref:HD domain-containing protein n=1 Tax=Bacillus mesophilus TaxID=1808955 RepID=A0A6M0QAM2_9BACI|nr:HD domain-containing protein [Bacillus mesophilus]MBM7662045.1 HD superfamily phosphohydrolase [Bacillus mesophilus]NEY72600.1 HD domain-containing protein [Bacillus mesophilus]